MSKLKYASSLAAELNKRKKARAKLENQEKQKAQPTVIEIDDDDDPGSVHSSRTQSPAPLKQPTPKFSENIVVTVNVDSEEQKEHAPGDGEEARPQVPFPPHASAEPVSPPRRSIAHLPMPPAPPTEDASGDFDHSPYG